MSQTSENEWEEQIWSGWSKFGVGGENLVWVEQVWSGWRKFRVGGADVGRTVWRVADKRKRCCVSFYFRGLNFLTRYLYAVFPRIHHALE